MFSQLQAAYVRGHFFGSLLPFAWAWCPILCVQGVSIHNSLFALVLAADDVRLPWYFFKSWARVPLDFGKIVDSCFTLIGVRQYGLSQFCIGFYITYVSTRFVQRVGQVDVKICEKPWFKGLGEVCVLKIFFLIFPFS